MDKGTFTKRIRGILKGESPMTLHSKDLTIQFRNLTQNRIVVRISDVITSYMTDMRTLPDGRIQLIDDPSFNFVNGDTFILDISKLEEANDKM